MPYTSSRLVNYVLLFSYIGLLSVLLWRHEMWRDELHTWTIVTHARSLPELLYNKRYEGHPALWYVLLWPFSRLSAQPFMLQLVHGLLAVVTAGLVIFRSPFRFWEKALLIGGYFLLYEYGIISRNYQIGVLIALGLIAHWPLLLRQPIVLGAGLALLFQTSAFGMLLGLGIGAAFLVSLIQTRSTTSRQVLAGAVLSLLGLVGAYLAMRTPPDLTYQVPFQWHWDGQRAQAALATVYQGLLPIPAIGTITFWNTNLLTDPTQQAALALICLLAVLWSLRNNPAGLALFGVTTLLILLFAYTSYTGSARHNGHYAIALIGSYWLGRQPQPTRPPSPLSFFTVFLLVQGATGLFAAYMDGRYTFSMARPVADYLKRRYPPNVIVAGSYNNLMTPVAGYLGRDVYTLSTSQYGSYVLWNETNWNKTSLTMPDSALFARYLVFQRQHPNSVLVMAYQPFSHPGVREGSVFTLRTAGQAHQFQCVAAFQPAIVPDENYYIYQLRSVTQPQ